MDISSNDLAKHYGVTGQTIINWSKSGCPCVSGGGKGKIRIFDSIEVHNWLLEREVKSRIITTDGKHHDRQEEEARLKHHQANLEELKEQEKRGELIPLDIAVSEYGEKITNARAKILTLGESLPKKHKDVLDVAIRKVLDELSQPEAQIS